MKRCLRVSRGNARTVMSVNASGLTKCATPTPATARPARVATRDPPESCGGTVDPICSRELVVAQGEARRFPDGSAGRHGPQESRLTARIEIVGARGGAVADLEHRI